VSLTDTYEVEEIGCESMWLRCRQCGHTWRVFDGKSWRCPAEHDHLGMGEVEQELQGPAV
jgi:hypothetical protein